MDNIKAHFLTDWNTGIQPAFEDKLSLVLLIFVYIVLFVVHWFDRDFRMVKL